MDGAEEGAMDLKDEQWTIIAPLIPEPKVRADLREIRRLLAEFTGDRLIGAG